MNMKRLFECINGNQFRLVEEKRENKSTDKLIFKKTHEKMDIYWVNSGQSTINLEKSDLKKYQDQGYQIVDTPDI